MTVSRNWVGCVAALCLGVLPGVVAAVVPGVVAWVDDPVVAAAVLADGDHSSHERIIDEVQKRLHAKVVRVAETLVNGRHALELRLLSDQRVWNIVVDASSGQVLSGG